MYRHIERVSSRGFCAPKNLLPARQPFHEGLAVIPHALLDRDEKMALLFETILEMLVADDLHGLRLHPTPMCGSVPDDCGRRKLDSRQLRTTRLRWCSTDRGNAWIVM